jgi:hypothetical protein
VAAINGYGQILWSPVQTLTAWSGKATVSGTPASGQTVAWTIAPVWLASTTLTINYYPVGGDWTEMSQVTVAAAAGSATIPAGYIVDQVTASSPPYFDAYPLYYAPL